MSSAFSGPKLSRNDMLNGSAYSSAPKYTVSELNINSLGAAKRPDVPLDLTQDSELAKRPKVDDSAFTNRVKSITSKKFSPTISIQSFRKTTPPFKPPQPSATSSYRSASPASGTSKLTFALEGNTQTPRIALPPPFKPPQPSATSSYRSASPASGTSKLTFALEGNTQTPRIALPPPSAPAPSSRTVYSTSSSRPSPAYDYQSKFNTEYARAPTLSTSSYLSRSPAMGRLHSSTFSPPRGSVSGLQNLGNTCYLNAVAQLLLSALPFVAYLRALSGVTAGASPMLFALRNILSERGPDGLRRAVAEREREFEGWRQQDAHEFLMVLLGGMEAESRRECARRVNGKENEPLVGEEARKVCPVMRSFGLGIAQTLRCEGCADVSERVDEFRVLSLDVPAGGGDLMDRLLVDFFTEPETVERKCEKCGLGRAELSYSMHTLPEVLLLHVKRFVPSYFAGRYEKSTEPVSFSETLDVSMFLSDGARERPGLCTKYVLCAVVLHLGASRDSGHYIAKIRRKGTWYAANDSRVEGIALDDVVHHARTRESAYLWAYIREDRVAKSEASAL